MNREMITNALKTMGVVDADLYLALDENYEAMVGFGLTTPRRWAHFLGQCHHESAGFSVVEENLRYPAKRLAQVWPSRFPPAKPGKCAYNPEALANVVYGGRMGNVRPGDGWAYRGRGYIQLTGKNNYLKYSNLLGLDLVEDPWLVTEPSTGLLVAAMYFSTRTRRGKTLLELASINAYRDITKGINGGTHGLQDRKVLTEKYLEAIQGATPVVVPKALVRQGQRNAHVKLLQQRLTAAGTFRGNCTGFYGTKTLKAVVAFQRASGLKPDGIVGSKTWEALYV